MIGLHTQNQMLEVYSLICQEKYDFKEPVERNLASHRRMQASCYLSSLLFLFPDFSFSFDKYGPYSAGVELALRLMKKSEKAVKLTDSQCIPTLTIIDLHEKILNPLFKNIDIEICTDNPCVYAGAECAIHLDSSVFHTAKLYESQLLCYN